MSDCKACKGKYKECIGQESYTVEDIRWCPHQVVWLIEEFFQLSGNGVERTVDIDWPMLEFGLPSVDKTPQSSAYFTKPVEIIAELHWRLERLGRSADLLLAELQAGMEGHLTDEADAGLHFITGYRRKRQPFYKWKSDRKRRRE